MSKLIKALQKISGYLPRDYDKTIKDVEYPPDKKLLDPDSPTGRVFQKGHTYRLPSNGRPFHLVWLEEVGEKTVKFKSQETGKIIEMPKQKAQKMLDEGELTVSV